MEIRPTAASLAQVSRAKDGRLIQIDDDVQGIAQSLHEIDPHLRLRYSEAGEYFVVYWHPENSDEGDGYLVTTAQELDGRLVHLIRELYWKSQQPGYSFADELDAEEDRKQKEADQELEERVGEIGERLAFAMRQDLGYNDAHIVVPKDIDE